MLIIAIAIGYIDDVTGPQEYYYQDGVVNVYKKYQCPTYCAVNHPHFVYYNSDTDGIVIDKNQLGKKVKKKKYPKKK